MDIDKYSKSTLSLQLDWIKSADAKVPPLFAINAAMLGVIATLLPDINNWDIQAAIFTLLSIVPLVASVICLALTAFPRLSGPVGSVVFFAGITARTEDDFISEVTNMPDETLVNDMLQQVYRNAEIAKSKYTFIKKSMVLSFSSLPLWFISVWYLYNI